MICDPSSAPMDSPTTPPPPTNTPLTTVLRDRYEITSKQISTLYKDMDDAMKVLEKREREVEKREKDWANTVALMEQHANNAKQKIILDVGMSSLSSSLFFSPIF